MMERGDQSGGGRGGEGHAPRLQPSQAHRRSMMEGLGSGAERGVGVGGGGSLSGGAW